MSKQQNTKNNSLFTSGRVITDVLSNKKFYSNTVVHMYDTRNNAATRNSRRNVTNDVEVSLDESFSKIDYVPGLKTTLYPHQKTAVKAMLDMERKRCIKLEEAKYGSIINLTYNASVLSEPVGSGKTINMLAIICLSKTPRPIPDIMELKMVKSANSVGYIRRKFRKFLTPTVVFVGVSVMRQWEQAIKTFTNLQYFSVHRVEDLRVMFTMIENKAINKYDIVLIKNGYATGKVILPNDQELEPKNKGQRNSIYNLVANLRNYCWSRVAIDDFDTIKLPHNAGIVNAVYTWYISSTRKTMERRDERVNHRTVSDILLYHDYGCSNIMYNHILFGKLNVRNDIEYLKSTTAIPCPKYHVVLFKNPNNVYLSLLGSMGDTDINRITEMLNGDAYSAAAEAAGIKSTSVANIFETILGNKYKQYRFSGDLLAFIDNEKENEPSRMPIPNNADLDITDEDGIKIYRYGKKDLLDFRSIEYKFPGVKKILNDTETEYTEVKNKSGLAIQRIKDNIKHGVCPVCAIDLDDSKGVIVVKCCQAVFCEKCGIAAQNLNNRYNKLQRGRCSNCRSNVSIKDLIYIGDDFGLEDIEEENFEDDVEDTAPVEELKKEKKPTTKYTAIIDIIRGEQIADDKRVDLHIPNMMKGAAYLPEAKIRKVLIFANFDETLNNIIKELKEENIKYWRLHGTSNEINDTSLAFTACNETCALVINSTKHCSGLNLQTATDLIFAHRMIDQAVESQVAGRGHRLGRTNPLNIWYLLYDNEYAGLQVSHSVRELTEDDLKHEKAMELGTEHSTIADVEDNKNKCTLK